jgi:tRNA threonylcarbamoyladenosine biosynthesis protein TsaE
MIILSDSPERTMEIAENFAKGLKTNDIVLLNGEMGAGKTVFAKGIAKGLGIKKNITSPTYIYMNDYDSKLFHYDCYRLKSGDEAESLGLCDYFSCGGICIIEWSENIKDILPENCITVNIKKITDVLRKIEL